jgi:hypothetical protein
MKKILFILTISSFALTSCEDFFSQTVEIDPPPYTKQLSFHLNLSDQDSTVRMTLGRNFGILETVPNYNDFLVKGGTAELYKDGQKWLTLAPLSNDSSFVLVGNLPQPLQIGSTYEIRAAHPDFPPTSASQTMPNDFMVDSARVKRNAISGQFGDEYDLVDVFLQDQGGVRNYYEFKMTSGYYATSYDPNTGTFDTIGYYEYPIYPEEFSDPNVAFGVGESGLISDQFFDGQSYKFQVRIYSNSIGMLSIHVRNITEEYYKWSRSYQAKFDAEDNPLVEPVSVFSNLVDGLGIFSVARGEGVYRAIT